MQKSNDIIVNALQKNTSSWVTLIFVLVLGAYLLLVLYGCVRYFTPVPIEDMWDAYLQFYLSVLDGDYVAWWKQINEHRILLPKLLFWFELTFFNGSIVFLNVVNVCLLLALFGFLMHMIVSFRRYTWREPRFTYALLVVGVLMFSWVQYRNLTWAFQSQFFMVYFFALLAFYLYHNSLLQKGRKSKIWFWGSIIVALLSVASMANGLLCLPILFVMSCLRDAEKKHKLIFGGLTLLSFALYFIAEETIQANHSLLHELVTKPLLFIKHTMLSLGGPFYYVSILHFSKKIALGLAFLIGAFLFVFIFVIGVSVIKNRKENQQKIVLFVMLLFVSCSIALTSLARMRFGLDHALTVRYMTPSLLLMCLLYMLNIQRFERYLEKHAQYMWAGLFLLAMPFLYFQFSIISFVKNADQKNSNQMVAALALEMGIYDRGQIEHVCPADRIDDIMGTAALAAEKNISIFSHSNIQRASEVIGNVYKQLPDKKCIGQIAVKPIAGVTTYSKVVGFILQEQDKTIPKRIVIVDHKQNGIGYGLTGYALDQVAKVYGPDVLHAGFVGYIRNQKLEGHIDIIGEGPNCKLEVKITP
ncbi:MAG: hypothetical protein R3A45_04185 [Bdellovibrionota bacterium]